MADVSSEDLAEEPRYVLVRGPSGQRYIVQLPK